MVAALVLAAGRSRRFGKLLKPLLRCGGTSFLGAILDTLASSRVDDVRVVLGHEADRVIDAVAVPREMLTINAGYESGMLSSMQHGIRALPQETKAFLLWPVDHPLVRVETVDRLVDEFVRRGRPLVLPLHAGRRGHPVLFSAALTRELMEAPPTTGARAVVHAHAADRVEVAVDDPGVIADIDNPAAYARAFGRAPEVVR
jgi:molybdenum cofactor cytidylyltransferase